MIDDLNLNETIEQLIKEGQIKALCHNCNMPLSSIYEKKCRVCSCKIILNNIVLKTIEESDLN